ncbi:MAG: hypothetical protein QS98_C0003G0097 [archaeon GW2011_AR3]|nr:MAG: hypothetical protein QS98_C0003G0097 [archaeon GW2011_AR3]MBS3110139.1 hypothetical protein [Candidatus Woesearchaeota archaeon]
MPEIEMMVSLVIPDNTAITATNVLRKMGYSKLLNIKREEYYKFTFDGDSKSFADKISKVDIIMNFNKHRAVFKKPQDPWGDRRPRILVKDKGDMGSKLAGTLKHQLGVAKIKKVEKGILWTLAIDEKPENVAALAWEMARKLLYNRHYQTADIVSK